GMAEKICPKRAARRRFRLTCTLRAADHLRAPVRSVSYGRGIWRRWGRLGATHKYWNRVTACAAAACAAVLLILLSASAPLKAPVSDTTNAVDVALVLAVDASGSVDDDRFELQKRGFAAALRNQKVLNAIEAGDHRAIAI